MTAVTLDFALLAPVMMSDSKAKKKRCDGRFARHTQSLALVRRALAPVRFIRLGLGPVVMVIVWWRVVSELGVAIRARVMWCGIVLVVICRVHCYDGKGLQLFGISAPRENAECGEQPLVYLPGIDISTAYDSRKRLTKRVTCV